MKAFLSNLEGDAGSSLEATLPWISNVHQMRRFFVGFRGTASSTAARIAAMDRQNRAAA
jgi:hypothetical protein